MTGNPKVTILITDGPLADTTVAGMVSEHHKLASNSLTRRWFGQNEIYTFRGIAMK